MQHGFANLHRKTSPHGSRPSRALRAGDGSTLVMLVAALAMVLAGAFLVAYPYLSSYLNQLEQNKVAQVQDQVIATASKEDLSAELARAQDYNERLRNGLTRVVDPFDPASQQLSNEEYVSVLNVGGDGVMGTISIPCINVSLPIYHGTEGDFMNHAVGHVTNTSVPVGGPSTHSVLAGHTGLPSAQIFDRLDQMQVGDWFVINVLGEDHAYRVYGTEVVLPDQTESLAIQDGRDLVTLVTCTPYGINTHRLLIHAERCDVPQEWLDRDNKGDMGVAAAQENLKLPLWALSLIGVALGAIAAVIVMVLRHHGRGAHATSAPTGKHMRR